jgi:uncharacterized protein (DUF1330 family)
LVTSQSIISIRRHAEVAAYVVVRVSVTDQDKFQEYLKATPAIIAKHQGKYIARGGEVTTLEGPQETRRIVIIEFPSLEKARQFYDSREYQAAKKLREGAAVGEIVVVEGVRPR